MHTLLTRLQQSADKCKEYNEDTSRRRPGWSEWLPEVNGVPAPVSFLSGTPAYVRRQPKEDRTKKSGEAIDPPWKPWGACWPGVGSQFCDTLGEAWDWAEDINRYDRSPDPATGLAQGWSERKVLKTQPEEAEEDAPPADSEAQEEGLLTGI